MLETNREDFTIMDVDFETHQAYEAAFYALTSNIVEGGKPTKEDVLLLKESMHNKHPELFEE